MNVDAQQMFERQGACLLAHSGDCWVWQFRNETGDGTMTVYQVFPGVMLSLNDFHMERYDCSFVSQGRMLAIDHCREGRMEYAVGDNLVGYTASGDMKLDLRRQHAGVFSFPSCHYHGLTVGFDLDIAARSLAQQVRDFPVTPEKLLERWVLADTPRVVHGAQGTEHIFGELYRVPEKIRMPLFQAQNFRAAAVPGCHDHPRRQRRAALFLQIPGGKGEGHPAVSHGACGGELHTG